MGKTEAPLKPEDLLQYANSIMPDKNVNWSVRDQVDPVTEIASLRQRRASKKTLEDIGGLDWMLSCNRDRLLRDQEVASDGYYDWRNDAAQRKELADKLIASQFDKEAQEEIASYRQFVINSDLLATPFALGAFQSINLSADELPQIITPKARQYFNVRYIGQDGGSRQDQWRTARSAAEIEMNAIMTDKIEYPLDDLQQGDVNEFESINAQLRFDMEMKIDTFAKTNMDAGQVNSGLRDMLNIHPMISTANIPDTNYLDLTSTGTYGAANVLTIQRIKAILAQMSMWGFGLDPDGPIRIKSMTMSPLHARDSWDYTNLVSGWNNSDGETDPRNTVPTAVREKIFAGGSMINSAWGYTWQNIYNTQLAAGRLYVMTNQPIGWYFTKTNFDRMIEWKDTPDNIETNMAQVLYRKALRFYMPSLWAYRYLIVDF